ncbi:MAG: DUF4398 domain-containing protein [Deltaproteobacteria bacterium]|nr:DUF4398 domain-containing protein [Deltaproteobacteria bacterium]
MRRTIPGMLMLGLPLGILACGASRPVEKETDTKAAVRAAEEVGAEGVPQSALYLDLAKQQIASAEKLMKDGEQEKAARVLERAKADAEVAIAVAKAEGEKESAQQAAARVQQLQDGRF